MLTHGEFDCSLDYFAKKWQLPFENADAIFESIAGYGLEGSSIDPFGRVGSGIYTKGADVGTDLSERMSTVQKRTTSVISRALPTTLETTWEILPVWVLISLDRSPRPHARRWLLWRHPLS